MSEAPSWEGVPGAAEHRTAGPHRAWCLNDHEWCYPDEDGMCPCCQSTLGREALWVDPKVGPPERVILQDLIAELREQRGIWLEGGMDPADYAVFRVVALQVAALANRAEARLQEASGDE